jgi:signal transduction histidine kinase
MNIKLRFRMEDLEANHAKDIQAIQKVIYQQTLQDLATDIHDDFGQRLSLIKLMLSGLDPETRPDIGPQIIEIMQLATQTINDLRTLAHRLRANNPRQNPNS